MKEHLDKFDLLRGIAIVLVVGYHIMSAAFGDYELPTQNSFFVDLTDISSTKILLNLFPFAFGNNGVVLFLIISGFLIHYNYLSKKQKFNPSLFFNKRFWRIYPPYLAALILFGLTVAPTGLADWLFHLLLIHNTRNGYIYSINPSFWSLALEVQLYLIYPVFLYVYHKFGNFRAFIFTAGISLLLVFMRIIFHIDKITFITSVFSYWGIWTAGAYLAHTYHVKKRISNVSLFGLTILVMTLILSRLTIVHQYFSPYLFTLFFILLIDRLLYTELPETKIYKLLETIGLCSYSIYLFHQPVLSFLKDTVFIDYPLTSSIKLLILLTVSVLVSLLSYLSYRTLEISSVKAGNRFYRKYFQKPTPAPTPTPQLVLTKNDN